MSKKRTWRKVDLKGVQPLYSVSNDKEPLIRRNGFTTVGINGVTVRHKPIVLTASRSKNGTPIVSLRKVNGGQTKRAVKGIVERAFPSQMSLPLKPTKNGVQERVDAVNALLIPSNTPAKLSVHQRQHAKKDAPDVVAIAPANMPNLAALVAANGGRSIESVMIVKFAA